MLRFLVELRKVKEEFRAKFGDEEYSKKSMEYLQVCCGNFQGMEYLL